MLRTLLSLSAILGSLPVALWIRRAAPLRLGEGPGSLALAQGHEAVVAGVALALLVWLAPGKGSGRKSRLAAGLGLAAIIIWLGASAWLPRPADAASEVEAGAADERRKIVLVGIDGLAWERLLPLVREGKLPTFAALMEEGAYGVLHSYRAVRPTTSESGFWSPVVWTTLATGVGADRHGIVDFSIERPGGGLELAATYHRRAPAFWNLWSAFGRQVGVVGWWATWPAEEVAGVVASSGLGLRRQGGERDGEAPAPDVAEVAGLTFPEAFADELEREVRPPADTDSFIDRRLFPLSSYPILAERDAATFRSVVWQDRYYERIARYLLETRDLDLLAVYFEGVDLAGHLFWRYLDDPERLVGVEVPDGFTEHARLVDRYYGVVDRMLAGLLARAGDGATVVVCSDHGFAGDPDHRQFADHTGYGVILARGPGIRAGHDLNLSLAGWLGERRRDPVDALDLLPTLLYLEGLPIADDLPGRVLWELFERDFLARHPVRAVAGYGDFEATRRVEVELPAGDEEEYLERLRSLGYID